MEQSAMAGLAEMPAIVRLNLAVVRLPASHPAASLGTRVPVYGFCILHPDGPILVDTGVGFGNELIDDLYEPVPRSSGTRTSSRPKSPAMQTSIPTLNSG